VEADGCALLNQLHSKVGTLVISDRLSHHTSPVFLVFFLSFCPNKFYSQYSITQPEIVPKLVATFRSNCLNYQPNERFQEFSFSFSVLLLVCFNVLF